MLIHSFFVSFGLFAGVALAHIAAFKDGMYCRNGNEAGVINQNSNAPIGPLFNLTKAEFWFQADRSCPNFPPKDGEFLELPAGGSFTVELANNQAFSSLSYGGSMTTDWPDGNQHPEDWHGDATTNGCLTDGGYMHTNNRSMAAGTAFAISYHPMSETTLENLVVFSVAEKTPWKRITTYDVPADMPACKPEGCTCAWLWVPHGCGQPNMYMQGFKCKVTGAKSTNPVGKAQPPTFCENDASKCVSGPKQMIVYQQFEANLNIVVPEGKYPGYNEKCGWKAGAQNDIFVSASQPTATTVATAASSIMSTTATAAESSSTDGPVRAKPEEVSSSSTTTGSAPTSSACTPKRRRRN